MNGPTKQSIYRTLGLPAQRFLVYNLVPLRSGHYEGQSRISDVGGRGDRKVAGHP